MKTSAITGIIITALAIAFMGAFQNANNLASAVGIGFIAVLYLLIFSIIVLVKQKVIGWKGATAIATGVILAGLLLSGFIPVRKINSSSVMINNVSSTDSSPATVVSTPPGVVAAPSRFNSGFFCNGKYWTPCDSGYTLYCSKTLGAICILPTTPADVTSSQILTLVNQERVTKNLPPLAFDPILQAAADAKAKDMATRSYATHVSPDGIGPEQLLRSFGFTGGYGAENYVVVPIDTSATTLVGYWIASPGHLADILGEHYTQTGIGIAIGDYKGWPNYRYVVQEFGGP